MILSSQKSEKLIQFKLLQLNKALIIFSNAKNIINEKIKFLSRFRFSGVFLLYFLLI
jgi:hypothetical protein